MKHTLEFYKTVSICIEDSYRFAGNSKKDISKMIESLVEIRKELLDFKKTSEIIDDIESLIEELEQELNKLPF